MSPLCPPRGLTGQESTWEGTGGVRGTCRLETVLDTTPHRSPSPVPVRPAGGFPGALTWGDEEGSPQLLVPRDVPDLPGHVDHPAGHGGDAAEVQDPGRKGMGGVI